MTDIERAVAAHFASDVAGHRMMVRLDHGLHRHLVFEQREHAWNNRFELITAPGSLTITGDRGAHTFRRMVDMFQFFRQNGTTYRINPSYWAEKLPDSGRSVKVYSEEVTRQRIAEHLADAVADRDSIQKELDEENERQLDEWREDLRAEGVTKDDPDYPRPAAEADWPGLVKAHDLVEKAEEEIADYDSDGYLAHEDGARQLLRQLEEIGLVSDTWEWDLHDWDYHFLWNLHAIAWGIRQYDRAVKLGLHVVRGGTMAWDAPLPTLAPAKPKSVEATPAPPMKMFAEIKVLVPVGDVL